MRAKSIAILLGSLIYLVSEPSVAAMLALSATLSSEDVAELKDPVFTRQIVRVDSGEVLVITHDYGYGLEIREAYIYCRAGETWELFVYQKTNSSKLTVTVTKEAIILVGKSGDPLMTVPLAALSAKFDKREH